MKPIEFKQCNVKVAEKQDQYGTLPAHHSGDIEGTVTSCWELTPEEIEQVKESGRIYLQQLTFNEDLQPVMLHTQNPLEG